MPERKLLILWIVFVKIDYSLILIPVIQILADYVNAYAQKMKMKREALADKAIWTAKKRYILNVYNSEGVVYAEPSIKIQGLEAIKSSTPSACREN